MLAACVRKPGGPEAVQLLQTPVPVPTKGQVLIEVAYSNLNPVDVKIRSGEFLPWLLKSPKAMKPTPALALSCLCSDAVIRQPGLSGLYLP